MSGTTTGHSSEAAHLYQLDRYFNSNNEAFKEQKTRAESPEADQDTQPPITIPQAAAMATPAHKKSLLSFKKECEEQRGQIMTPSLQPRQAHNLRQTQSSQALSLRT